VLNPAGESHTLLLLLARPKANIGKYLNNATLSSAWDGADQDIYWEKFNIVSKLMMTHDFRGTDRDVFFMRIGGWDNHANVTANLRENFSALNKGLTLFVKEMKNQGIWKDVVFVFTSDFGRTLTPNSGSGSDHAWGGNYFAMGKFFKFVHSKMPLVILMFVLEFAGGSMHGGQVLGEYPYDITDAGPLNIGRGALIPTTAWDNIWNGVAGA
jgi:uncharacterized protein (DUF1501 family)